MLKVLYPITDGFVAMDVTASSQIAALAAVVDGKNAVQTTMLKKSLDVQQSAMTQLLQALPQKDGAGQLVDAYA